MRIIDRYIIASIAGSFIFGVAVFLALLLAMNLLQPLIQMIAEQGIPLLTALKIFSYRIPGNLALAFPMAELLGILLVFNRMSSESEMVAIRASGVSFFRLLLPVLTLAGVITVITFWLMNSFSPYASGRAQELLQAALKTARGSSEIQYLHKEKGVIQYSLVAADLDLDRRTMSKFGMTMYDKGVPSIFVYADSAEWNLVSRQWALRDFRTIDLNHGTILSGEAGTPGDNYASGIKENPIDLAMSKKKPEEMSATQIRQQIQRLRELGKDPTEGSKWATRLYQRFAVPFTCLVFALIGAPLGLRNHRTGSAVGLGISIVLIFIYYFVFNFLQLLGDNGRISPLMAAWFPNLLGVLIGAGLIVRANR